MKFRYFFLTAVLATAILCSAGFVSAQATDNSALIAQLQAQIQSLMQQIQQLIAQQGGGQSWCHTFNTNMGYGAAGDDFSALLTILDKESILDNSVPKPQYDEIVGGAVVKLQAKYGILQTGYVGPLTRAKINSLYKCGITQSPTCIPSVECGAWSSCVNGQQTRTCTDSNNCTPGPITTQNCGTTPAITTPTVNFTANGSQGPVVQISAGQLVNLAWTSTNANYCSAYANSVLMNNTITNGVADFTQGKTSATIQVQPRFDITYTVICSDPAGQEARGRITLQVATVSEQYKCIFNNATSQQTCGVAEISSRATCSGVGTCGDYVKGYLGEKLTWKSSCGGYAYTTIDGTSEYANFDCSSTQPTITVTSPNGETWKDGETHNITWSSTGMPSAGTVDIKLINSSGTVTTIASNVSVWANSYAWLINVYPGNYTIQVKTSSGTAVSDTSDYFFIVAATTQPSFAITSPANGTTVTDRHVNVQGTCSNYSGAVLVNYNNKNDGWAPQCVNGNWSTTIYIDTDVTGGSFSVNADVYNKTAYPNSTKAQIQLNANF